MGYPDGSHLGQVGSGTTTTFPTQSANSTEYPVGMTASIDGYLLDGKTRVVQATPTVSASPDYSAGDHVGGLLTFTSALPSVQNTGTLLNASILDKAAVGPAVDLFIFDRSVTVGTDNAASAVSDADMAYCLGVISFSAGHFVAPGTANKFATRLAGLGVTSNTSGNLYGMLIATAAINLAATDDIVVSLTVRAD